MKSKENETLRQEILAMKHEILALKIQNEEFIDVIQRLCDGYNAQSKAINHLEAAVGLMQEKKRRKSQPKRRKVLGHDQH